jgi:hypothetical protein
MWFPEAVDDVGSVLGLAFELGGRDTASEIVCTWYQQSQQTAPKMERAVNLARQREQPAGE